MTNPIRVGVVGCGSALRGSYRKELDRDIKGVSRCIRLNNYWCVKKAGWTGEIASDPEGHVAFASAADGAGVAANLLRRYYVDFNLHSARAIVQRWAPAQCGPAPVAFRGPRVRVAGPGGKAMGGRTLLGPEPRGLTTRGLGSTLRARWLASHSRGFRPRVAGKPARVAVRRSVVPDRVGPMMKTPTARIVARRRIIVRPNRIDLPR